MKLHMWRHIYGSVSLIQKSYLCTIAIHICGMLFTTTYTVVHGRVVSSVNTCGKVLLLKNLSQSRPNF